MTHLITVLKPVNYRYCKEQLESRCTCSNPSFEIELMNQSPLLYRTQIEEGWAHPTWLEFISLTVISSMQISIISLLFCNVTIQYVFVSGGEPQTKWDVGFWAPHYTCNNSLRIQSITAVLCHISQWGKKKRSWSVSLGHRFSAY